MKASGHAQIGPKKGGPQTGIAPGDATVSQHGSVGLFVGVPIQVKPHQKVKRPPLFQVTIGAIVQSATRLPKKPLPRLNR